jgi:hypothetical protein
MDSLLKVTGGRGSANTLVLDQWISTLDFWVLNL